MPVSSDSGRTALAGLLCGVAAVGGNAWQLQQAALWPLPAYAALGVAAGLVLLLSLRLPAWRMALPLAALGAGLALAGARASDRLAQALPTELEGRDLVATGVVATLPQAGPSGLRFVFDVESATLQGQPVTLPPRLSLGWYRGWHDEVPLADPWAGLRAGQRWRLPLRLKRPHGLRNPGGFDTELWLFEQGLRATGHVRSTAALPAERLPPDAAGYPVQRLRQALRDAITQRVPHARSAGLLAALAVGDQGAIERDDWELYRATGVAHLMSISGLHVTMFAWLGALVVGAAWRRCPRLMLWRPAPGAARWGGVGLAAAYALLAGWGVPAQRTVCMLAVLALLRGSGLRWPWGALLLAAAVAVSVLDPWALLQPGFWLSFVAVALLMMSGGDAQAAAPPAGAVQAGAAPTAARGSGAREHRPAARVRGLLRGALRTQLIATLGLAPLTLVCFQQLSIVGFAANLVAIPLVTLVITPLALLGALVPPLWTLGALVAQGLDGLLSWLATPAWAAWHVPVAAPWAQAAGLLGGAVGLMPWPWRLRLLALPLVLPLLWPAPPLPPPGRFELLAADVGQGTAVLLRTHEHLLLYDSGPQYSPENDAGQRVLLPLLRTRGERPVDLLVLSHRDTDHTGGAASLLRHWPVRAVTSSLEPGHPLRALMPHHTPCTAGTTWTWDGVRFTLLHPEAQALAAANADANANAHALVPARDLASVASGPRPKPNALSCVLRVQDTDGRSVLLTGDIEAAQEAALVLRDTPALQADLLIVPHHGSKTSSTPAFLAAVAPHRAFVQAGYRNRFGHPAPPVVARYEDAGITLLRSDRCGAWTWDGDSGHCERDVARRYWQTF